MNSAIAIFVKTPGASPLKTRLASTVGKDKAEQFYIMSLDSIKSTLSKLGISLYWAITEKECMNNKLWSGGEKIHSGEGDLGDRQSLIYNKLIQKHDKVILIGGDCPQIDNSLINETLNMLDKYNYVLGPSEDGGYYLFAGKNPIRSERWENIPWSSNVTMERLIENLDSKPYLLKILSDVDYESDLYKLKQQMPKNMNSGQKEIIKWIDELEN